MNQYQDRYQDAWDEILPAFVAKRASESAIIAQMSLDRLAEFLSNSEDNLERLSRKIAIERQLTETFPEYLCSRYFLRFTRTPYSHVKQLSLRQQELFAQLLNLDRFDPQSTPTNEIIRDYLGFQRQWIAGKIGNDFGFFGG